MGNNKQEQQARLFEWGTRFLSLTLWALILTHARSILLYAKTFLEFVVRQIKMRPHDIVLVIMFAILALWYIKVEGEHPKPI